MTPYHENNVKHGILILFHKDFMQLRNIINYFDNNFYIYIHIDKKYRITKEEIEWLRKKENIKGFYQKYVVNWGGFSVLKAELFLIKKAVENNELSYFHVISGQDYPLRSKKYFLNFFKRHMGQEFISFKKLPIAEWDEGTYKRYQRYSFYDYTNKFNPTIISFLSNLQKAFHIKRRIPDQYDCLFGGSNWVSITRSCAQYIVKCHNIKFYNRLKYTFAPEETFFPTIIMNSPYSKRVVNNNLRYIVWKTNSKGHPKILTQEDWGGITMNLVLFGRKVDPTVSKVLIKNIIKYLLIDEECKNDEHGVWLTNTYSGHFFDKSLGEELIKLLPHMKLNDIGDFGCGPGWYTYLLHKNGYDINGYDGNPNTKELTSLLFNDGFYCQKFDLTDNITTKKPFDMIICLEVGEHIPQKYEETFFSNLVNNAAKYILLSWAIPGQIGWGHINCHTNEYVISKMKQRGFEYDPIISRILRKSSSLHWFKNTIMFFRKEQ